MKQVMDELLKIKAMINESIFLRKEILDLKEACKYTGLSKSKLYKISSNHEIAVSKPEGKLYFKREDLNAYMMSNYIPSKENINNNIKSLFNKTIPLQ